MKINLKKLVLLTAVLTLCLSLTATTAFAASVSASLSARKINIYTSDIGHIKLTVKDGAFSKLVSVKSSNEKVVNASAITVQPTDDASIYSLDINTTGVNGSSTLTIKVELTNAEGKAVNKEFTVSVQVADDFMPQIKWNSIQLNDETGYPQLKLSMTDDYGLRNVCFVRTFTSETGTETTEIFDIITLGEKEEAICFRTLDLPGAYSVQVNDNAEKTNRLNSKTLITLVDTDDNGVADAYYTTDPNALIELTVAGGITTAEQEQQQ